MVRKKNRNRSAKPVKQEKGRRSLLWIGVAVLTLAVGGGLLYFLSMNLTLIFSHRERGKKV